MQFLFVCKSNFARSQIAEAVFNSISTADKAISAGTERGRVTGHRLEEFPEHSNLFICMEEMGFDIKKNIVKLLTPEMAEKADRIIVMAEKETWPDYLKKSDKVTFWEIEDMAGQSLEKFREARDRIKKLVEKTVSEYGETLRLLGKE